jgi:hypothetical protein
VRLTKQRQNKEAALALLEVARNELNRSRQLGYLSADPDYRALDKQISDLKKAVDKMLDKFPPKSVLGLGRRESVMYQRVTG